MSIYKKIFRKLTAKLENIKNTALRPIYRAKPEFKKISKLLELIHSTQINQEEVDKLLGEPLNISELEIQELISKTTNYKMINPSQEKDIQFLRKLGIFWEYVKVNHQPIDETGVVNLDTIEQEISILRGKIKSYQPCPGLKDEFDWSEKKIEFSTLNHYSQRIALSKGCLYAICPSSGKLLKSNCSFLVGAVVFYRFVGEQVFFILGIIGKILMYFPENEILISLDSLDVVGYGKIKIINDLKLYLILFRKQVLEYINSHIKNTVAFIDSENKKPEIGHYLINVLSAIEPVKDILKINAVKVISREPQFFGKINLIFPEIAEKYIEVIEEKSAKGLFEKMLRGNYFLCKINSYANVTEELATRIYTAAKRECSVDFLNHLEQVRNRHFPLIFITWRLHRRRWLSQVEGIINIINTLAESYPNLGIVFDGYSRIASVEDSPELIQAIQKEKEAVQKVANSVNPKVQIYDSIGCTVQESILWASIIDFYFASFGSGFVKPVWINNKPGITHEPHKCPRSRTFWLNTSKQGETVKQDEMEFSYYAELQSVLYRENCKMPLCIPKSCITDYPSQVTGEWSDWYTTDYDFDWRVAYKEILRLISLLEQGQGK